MTSSCKTGCQEGVRKRTTNPQVHRSASRFTSVIESNTNSRRSCMWAAAGRRGQHAAVQLVRAIQGKGVSVQQPARFMASGGGENRECPTGAGCTTACGGKRSCSLVIVRGVQVVRCTRQSLRL